jgi:hypothetical protein
MLLRPRASLRGCLLVDTAPCFGFPARTSLSAGVNDKDKELL